MDLMETLLDLERRFWDAAGDVGHYEKHFADDGMMAFHVGILDKPTILDAMEGAVPWRSATIDEPRLVHVDHEVAALVYTTEAVAADNASYRAAITSVYAYRNGDWTLVLHQQTPLA